MKIARNVSSVSSSPIVESRISVSSRNAQSFSFVDFDRFPVSSSL